jgi:hypothetical protein
MKIEEIIQDDDLWAAKLRRPPNMGESAGVALAWSEKLP